MAKHITYNISIGAAIISYIILGAPYYNYTTKDPQTLF